MDPAKDTRISPIADFPADALPRIRYVLTDIDDTLTHEGRLPAEAFLALERLQRAGFTVIPVTAGSSGWCDLIARMWPVDAVIGENGGFYFCAGYQAGSVERHFWADATERTNHHARLRAVLDDIRRRVPGTAAAPDQQYRETTLAITSVEGTLPAGSTIDQILARFGEARLRTAINSMWVLGWAGDFDKLAMTRRLMSERFSVDIDRERERFLYVGDSLNDELMFGFFPHSVGVATVAQYLTHMVNPPHWLTQGPGGAGFVEVADVLLTR